MRRGSKANHKSGSTDCITGVTTGNPHFCCYRQHSQKQGIPQLDVVSRSQPGFVIRVHGVFSTAGYKVSEIEIILSTRDNQPKTSGTLVQLLGASGKKIGKWRWSVCVLKLLGSSLRSIVTRLDQSGNDISEPSSQGFHI